jgi:hypothetical protein
MRPLLGLAKLANGPLLTMPWGAGWRTVKAWPSSWAWRVQTCTWCGATRYSDDKMKRIDDRDFGWEVAHGAVFATPADSPLHDGSSYRGLRVRRRGLGFVHRSRAILCRAVPNPSVLRSQLFRSLHQGAVTLERVLASGGGLDALAEVLNVDDAAAAFGLFASSLLLAANAVHVAGVVHRGARRLATHTQTLFHTPRTQAQVRLRGSRRRSGRCLGVSYLPWDPAAQISSRATFCWLSRRGRARAVP